MSILDEMKQSLIDGNHKTTGELSEKALADGIGAQEILDGGLLAGMEVIGTRFRNHDIFLPDVLLAARAMYAGLDIIKPHLAGGEASNRGAVVIGSVEGDLHDIGKNLVGILLNGAGFKVIDLGNNVSPAKFIEAAKEHDAMVVGMSALLTTTMPMMGKVIAGLKEAGLTSVKTIIGGAPVSEKFASDIGADAYGYDAAKASAILQEWAS